MDDTRHLPYFLLFSLMNREEPLRLFHRFLNGFIFDGDHEQLTELSNHQGRGCIGLKTNLTMYMIFILISGSFCINLNLTFVLLGKLLQTFIHTVIKNFEVDFTVWKKALISVLVHVSPNTVTIERNLPF